MDRCFEKHKVNLDPGSSKPEISIVYRPVDKYMSRLPHLIGSDKWREKWHVGLLDDEIVSAASSECYDVESLGSNMTLSNADKICQSMAPRSSFMASQDSLTKSTGSIGDQMVINMSGGLFEDIHDDTDPFMVPFVPSSSTIFRKQPDERKIVNLFNDEPPECPSEPSPTPSKKPIILFTEDTDSIESLAVSIPASDTNKPPVDLFNDSEFDNFIKTIEKSRNMPTKDAAINAKEPLGTQSQRIKVMPDAIKVFAEATLAIKTIPKPIISKPETKKPIPEIIKSTEIVQQPPQKTKSPPKILDLFDDEPETDFFDEIMRQKSKISSSRSTEFPKIAPLKPKITNLFDDDDTDKIDYNSSMKKAETVKPSSLVALASNEFMKTSSGLFDDDDIFLNTEKSLPTKVPLTTPETIVTVPSIAQTKLKSLFDEIDDEKMSETGKNYDVDPERNARYLTSQPGQFTAIVNEIRGASEFITESVKIKTNDSIFDEELFEEKIEGDENTLNQVVSSSKNQNMITEYVNVESMPFLSDDPPPDEKGTFGTEDQIDEPEIKLISQIREIVDPMSYSVPLFDEMPPDDDFLPMKPSIHEPLFDSDDNEEYHGTENNFIPVPNEEPPLEDLPSHLQIPSNDEIDRSPIAGSIKSKLDILAEKLNHKVKDDVVPKRPLPKKLNTNLNIDVGAFMPGARLPPKKIIPDVPTEGQQLSSDRSNDSFASSSSDSAGKSSGLLNNDLTKTRVRIQVKRRPSTRRGRHKIYQKSLSDHLSDQKSLSDHLSEEDGNDTEPNPLLPSRSTTEPSLSNLSSTTKNLSESIFNEPEKEISTSGVSDQISHNIFPESSKSYKISVFYDDEDDIRTMLKQKKLQNENEKEISVGSVADEHVENDIFTSVTQPDVGAVLSVGKTTVGEISQSGTKTSSLATSIFFDDLDDDDLFGTPSVRKIIVKSNENKPVAKINQQVKQAPSEILAPKSSNTLFDDDGDDSDDLFGTRSRKKPLQPAKLLPANNHSSLFSDDSDDDLFNSSNSKG